ncbi:hypothetical protein F4820DRAFT_464284 [Hypoxylon rubiginosum]|uniref:Uncharacterized protein n=1 Tax=Hypoxylon rubiginosum TaxID=110542 RepID=A0ACB9ZBU1_9PEZI|nr:hypothetical protein F4820DRAFT_464284 [Hypoxylon rubiginosum]
MAQYTLLDQTSRSVPEIWFEEHLSRSDLEHESLKSFSDSEVTQLKSYHRGEASADEAACALTRPITNSSIYPLGGYSDHSRALSQLWGLLIDALIEWPPGQTPSLIALLLAIKEAPGHIHAGEATDDEEKPLSWSNLPYFDRVWSDNHWMSPGQITRRCPDAATRELARNVYIKQQDVEAQLVAAQVFAEGTRALRYLVKTFEREPQPDDNLDAADDSLADSQIKLDFQIPAAAQWVKHCGQELYVSLLNNEMEGWDELPSPVSFDKPVERWSFWEKRLFAISRNGLDETTREAAELAVGYMKAVTDASGVKRSG